MSGNVHSRGATMQQIFTGSYVPRQLGLGRFMRERSQRSIGQHGTGLHDGGETAEYNSDQLRLNQPDDAYRVD